MNIEYESRNFLIVSIIRLLSDADFSERNTEAMLKTSKVVRNIIENGGIISDEEIFHQYDKRLIKNEKK